MTRSRTCRSGNSEALRLPGDAAVTARVAALDGAIRMSVITRVELEGGVHRDPAHATVRRARVDAFLAAVRALAFDDAAPRPASR